MRCVVIAPSGQESPTCGVLISRQRHDWLHRLPALPGIGQASHLLSLILLSTRAPELHLIHADLWGTGGCPHISAWLIRCVAGDVVDRVHTNWSGFFSAAKGYGLPGMFRRKERRKILIKNQLERTYGTKSWSAGGIDVSELLVFFKWHKKNLSY